MSDIKITLRVEKQEHDYPVWLEIDGCREWVLKRYKTEPTIEQLADDAFIVERVLDIWIHRTITKPFVRVYVGDPIK